MPGDGVIKVASRWELSVTVTALLNGLFLPPPFGA